MIYSVISQKGGAGKTTTATNLAVQAVRDGLRVCLIDLDPQATSSVWHSARESDDIHLEVCHPPMLSRLIKRLDHDVIIIDTPPHNDAAAGAAAGVADVCVLPIRPSAFDLAAIQDTVDLIKRHDVPFHVILNSVPANSTVASAATEFLSELGVNSICGQTGQRMDFQHAAADGKGVVEVAETGKSAQEVKQIWSKIK